MDSVHFFWCSDRTGCQTEMDDNMSTNTLEDDMSTLSNDEPSEEVYPYVFPLSTHTIVASYLVIIGKFCLYYDLH